MVASFRPLAELGSMIGRTWMYPITTQVGFSWALNTCSAWKLQEQSYRLYFKTHLPYSNENLAPQTYFQYILLKQPRGQDNLSVSVFCVKCSTVYYEVIEKNKSKREEEIARIINYASNFYKRIFSCSF